MSESLPAKIRRMALRDLAEVESIDQHSFPLPWPAGAFRYELTKNEHAQCWVAESGGQVTGALVGYLVEDEYQIATIAVHPDFRRKGTGRALLEHALVEARRSGARTAFLEVRVGNDAAQSLYRQFGFRIVGERPRFYADGEDAFILRADLAQPAPDEP